VKWARPVGTPNMHALDRTIEGIAISICRESWIAADTAELYGEPDHEQRCKKCCAILVAGRCIELGITEMLSP
jgi:hypothetical protein